MDAVPAKTPSGLARRTSHWTPSPSRCCKTKCSACLPPCPNARPALSGCDSGSLTANLERWMTPVSSTDLPENASDNSKPRRCPSCAIPHGPTLCATTGLTPKRLAKDHQRDKRVPVVKWVALRRPQAPSVAADVPFSWSLSVSTKPVRALQAGHRRCPARR